MTGVESTLRAMLEGHTRKWTVIILIGLVLLVLGLPAADEYFALRQREQELTKAYRAEKAQLAQREKLDETAKQTADALAQFHARGLTDETLHEFRNQIVELTRGTGCQLRRLNMETVTSRPWLNEDHPLTPATRSRNRKKEEESTTGLTLRSQSISLSVSGKHEEISRLLAALEGTGKLMHKRSLSIRPVDSDRKAAVMELQFTVFGLTKEKRKPAA
jgi:Tfp pilus assembly protein PilO